MMELRQIQYFLCLFEEGTVTRAAKRLNIVQPALSMQIARLEEELDQKLFTRNPRGMQPTTAGRQMYQLFFPIMRDLTHAREQLLRAKGELRGHINVGMIASIAHGALAITLQEFKSQHPKVNVTIADGYSAILADWVAGGRLDAAIINKPTRPLGLDMEVITDEDMVLITSVDHRRALPEVVPLRIVDTLELALLTRHHGLRGIMEYYAQGADISLSPTIESDSVTSILNLVSNTQLATILPGITLSGQPWSPRLRTHRIVEPTLTRRVVCVTHPRHPLNQATSAFIELLTQHLQSMRIGAGAPKEPAPAEYDFMRDVPQELAVDMPSTTPAL